MAKVKKVKSTKKEKKTNRGVVRAAKPKMKKMPKPELKAYRAMLVKERDKVGGGLSHIAETTLNKSQREASGDLSGYSYHMADMASDDYERDFSLGRATDEQKIMYAIDEAMKRITEGTYGNCLQCGKAIPKKRLKALPYTEMCIECQKVRESK
ncbi:MAG: TraR/DksA C4-type zinc finger protein [Candidatus Omnitrophota bacterium]|nr:TraR/DksA C4-type zinc finger protein [Candidatus Omnitrophota bacterium]